MTSLLSSSSSDPHSPSSGKALDKSKVDYSVYLVTGRELLPEGVDFFQSLESSLKGGVTIVQLREKSIDNGEFRKIAVKCLEICDKYNVPLLINDNLSLCLSLPLRVGLHIGQTDIALPLARSLLGSSRLLGISCNTPSDAKTAREGGADYAGVGPVYGTLSKKGITEDKILGPRGVVPIVSALSDSTTQKRLPCVLIGGINQKTCLRSLFASVSKDNFADGVAVISAIQASLTPESAARELSNLVKTYKKGLHSIFSSRGSSFDFGIESAFGGTQDSSSKDISQLLKLSSEILKSHRDPPQGLSPPVIQTLTSHVSANFSANICLALSASPIMSQQFEEAEDLGQVTGAAVLNIGTIGPEARKGMKAVGMESNRGRKPVVLDPVGVGASAFRKGAVDEILNHTQITLIKGNAAELSSIYGGDSQVTSRGVDSGSGTLKDAPGLVKALAQRERCLVLLTGKVDLLSDGVRTVACENGHEMLGRVTGTGCGLGCTIATGLAAARNRWVVKNGEGGSDHIGSLGMVMVDADPQELFAGALMGLLSLTIASELAVARPEVKGPGTFIPALLDELAAISPETLLKRAKVQFI